MAERDRATRQRILEHAAALFADRGFKKVTVREICRAARANVAAVNYHFGDKLGLYRAVVRNAVAAMRETNELSVEAGRGAGPEDQLRAYVRVFLSRIIGSGPHSWIHKLMTREIEDPTEAFDEVIRDVIEPRHRYLSGIVASLSSLPVDDLRVTRAVASIQGQCFLFARPLPRKLPVSWRAVLRDVDGIIDHVAAFSLAGIRGMKNDNRNQPPLKLRRSAEASAKAEALAKVEGKPRR